MNDRERHFRALEAMYLGAPVNDFYDPEIRIEGGRAEISVAVRRALMHAADAVHGSVYFKLLDDACFFAANSLVDDVFVLTVSFNIYLTRPVTGGTMTAEARVVHRSRRTFLAEGEARDSDGRLIARGSGNFMRSTIELNENVGYIREQ